VKTHNLPYKGPGKQRRPLKVVFGGFLLMLFSGVFLLAMMLSRQAPVAFTGIALDGQYLYRFGQYEHRVWVLDGDFAIAQVDFFPPETLPVCVWIRSLSENLRYADSYTDQPIVYCGGVGWQHFVIEPRDDGWFRWRVEIGRIGVSEPDDVREFFVRRSMD
jgi:hypothetical protein